MIHATVRQFAVAALALGSFAASWSAAAQDVSAFYKGRTVSILMGTSPGGSYDLYGRVIAQHMMRHIPGNPTIIIEHMPGAGGATAGNFIYGPGPQDGSKILLAHALPLIEKLQGGTAVQYQSAKLNWLGAYDEISQVMAIWHEAPATSLDTLKSKDVVIGAMGQTHLSYQWASLLKDAIGAQYRIVAGYTSGGALNLAMEKGEVHGWTVALESITGTKDDWIKDKKVRLLAQFSMDRRAELADVPTLIELSPPDKRDIAEFLSAGTPIARAMAVGPGVPADRVAALRQAFTATVKDPAFLDDAKKRQLGIRYRSAEETQALVDKIVNAPASLVERVKKAVEPAK